MGWRRKGKTTEKAKGNNKQEISNSRRTMKMLRRNGENMNKKMNNSNSISDSSTQ